MEGELPELELLADVLTFKLDRLEVDDDVVVDFLDGFFGVVGADVAEFFLAPFLAADDTVLPPVRRAVTLAAVDEACLDSLVTGGAVDVVATLPVALLLATLVVAVVAVVLQLLGMLVSDAASSVDKLLSSV